MTEKYQPGKADIKYDGSIWTVGFPQGTYEQYSLRGVASIRVPLSGRSIEATLNPSGFEGAKRMWISEMTDKKFLLSVSKFEPSSEEGETALTRKEKGHEVDLTDKTKEINVLVRYSMPDENLPYSAEINLVEKTGQELRDELFQPNRERLEQLAARALQRGLTNDQFVIVLIDADDPTWTEEVDYLMPNHDWQQYRDQGEKPVARGSVVGFADYLSQVVPSIAPALQTSIPSDEVKAVVMGSGGASVYILNPSSSFN